VGWGLLAGCADGEDVGCVDGDDVGCADGEDVGCDVGCGLGCGDETTAVGVRALVGCATGPAMVAAAPVGPAAGLALGPLGTGRIDGLTACADGAPAASCADEASRPAKCWRGRAGCVAGARASPSTRWTRQGNGSGPPIQGSEMGTTRLTTATTPTRTTRADVARTSLRTRRARCPESSVKIGWATDSADSVG
jgi:hypothetical protein